MTEQGSDRTVVLDMKAFGLAPAEDVSHETNNEVVEPQQGVEKQEAQKVLAEQEKQKRPRKFFEKEQPQATTEAEKLKQYEAELNELRKKNKYFEEAYSNPFINKALKAMDEGLDMAQSIKGIFDNDPKNLSSLDLFKLMLQDDKIIDPDEIANEIESFENDTPFKQKKIVESKLHELQKAYEKSVKEYGLEKFYDKRKPNENLIKFAERLDAMIDANHDKEIDFLGNFRQTPQMKEVLQQAIKEGNWGGFNGQNNISPEDAYRNLLFQKFPEQYQAHIYNLGYQEALEGKLEAEQVRGHVKGDTAKAIAKSPIESLQQGFTVQKVG